jgi:hypothetical protein
MNLRTTRRITYTTPPTAAQAQAMEEIAAIDAADATPESAARRAELVEKAGTVTQLRATVGTMAALQMYRYRAHRRRVVEWIEAETGKTWSAAIDDPEGYALIRLALKWPTALASLVKLEIAESSPLDAGAEWREIEAPEEWQTPAGYLGSAPVDLIDAIDAAALAVNPAIYGGPMATGDAASVKKSGGISVE